MDFIKRNWFRIGLVVFIIFLAVPFIITDSGPTPEGEEQGSAPVVMSRNPLSKFFDRVSSFYTGKNKNAVRHDAAGYFGPGGQASALRKGEGPGRPGSPGSDGDIFIDDDSYASAGSSAAYRGIVADAQQEVQEFVRMDGKTYEVKTDAQGRKFINMGGKFVSFDKLMDSTVSREDYEAARKIAPNLSDAELVYAINYPGGVRAYLRSGDYGLFSHGGTPGMYGSVGGPGDSGGMYGWDHKNNTPIGWNSDEGQGNLAAKYSRTRRALSGDRAYNNASRAERAKMLVQSNPNMQGTTPTGAPVSEVAAIFKAETSIGNAPKMKVEQEKKEEALNLLAETSKEEVPIKDEEKPLTLVIGDNIDTVMPESDLTRAEMTKALLGGKTFVGEIPAAQAGGKNEAVINPWLIPNSFNDNPLIAFMHANQQALVNASDPKLEESFSESDTTFKSLKDTYLPKILEKVSTVPFVLIDGMDDNRNITPVKGTPYYENILEGLLNGKGDNQAKGGVVNFANLRPDTLIVVPNAEYVRPLADRGYKNVVVFNHYALTPNYLNQFYRGVNNNMAKFAKGDYNPPKGRTGRNQQHVEQLAESMSSSPLSKTSAARGS